MEIICMGFLIGVIFSMIVFAAGAIYDDRVSKRTCDGRNNMGVCCGGNTNVCNRAMGNIHGEVNCRRCVGNLQEEITGDDMK